MIKPEGGMNGPRWQPARIASVAPAAPHAPQNWGQSEWETRDRRADDERRIDVAALWRAGLKHAGIIALSLATALAIGAAVTLLTRPVYTAETVLQIDREAEKVVSAEDQTPV